MQLLPFFPELLHLELGLNEIQDLSHPIPSDVPTQVVTLNLQENKLQHWQNIIEGLPPFKR